jgi:hypothetical protein
MPCERTRAKSASRGEEGPRQLIACRLGHRDLLEDGQAFDTDAVTTLLSALSYRTQSWLISMPFDGLY